MVVCSALNVYLNGNYGRMAKINLFNIRMPVDIHRDIFHKEGTSPN